MKNFNKVVGNGGEAMAQKYLKKKKYKILETNYKNAIGEIDIIAKYKDVYIFIEVKRRETLSFGHPREAVTDLKQKKIRMVAEVYLKEKHLIDVPCRFDVIDIVGEEITHLENCF